MIQALFATLSKEPPPQRPRPPSSEALLLFLLRSSDLRGQLARAIQATSSNPSLPSRRPPCPSLPSLRPQTSNHNVSLPILSYMSRALVEHQNAKSFPCIHPLLSCSAAFSQGAPRTSALRPPPPHTRKHTSTRSFTTRQRRRTCARYCAAVAVQSGSAACLLPHRVRLELGVHLLRVLGPLLGGGLRLGAQRGVVALDEHD